MVMICVGANEMRDVVWSVWFVFLSYGLLLCLYMGNVEVLKLPIVDLW